MITLNRNRTHDRRVYNHKLIKDRLEFLLVIILHSCHLKLVELFLSDETFIVQIISLRSEVIVVSWTVSGRNHDGCEFDDKDCNQ